jgi:predicted nucleic acid-binding protein
MAEAISNTSPLLYLHLGGVLDHLGRVFEKVWIPEAVVVELNEGREGGHDVPDVRVLDWAEIIEPGTLESEWLTSHLGAGELAAIGLALQKPSATVLLDDSRARKMATAAGLLVTGTLGILIEFKAHRFIHSVERVLRKMEESGMWMSPELRERVLRLAGESDLL